MIQSVITMKLVINVESEENCAKMLIKQLVLMARAKHLNEDKTKLFALQR